MENNNRQENLGKLGNILRAHLLKIEIVSALFVLIGCGLRIDNNPAAASVLTITLTALAGVYYATAFSSMELDTVTTPMEVFGNKLTSFGLCIATIGILFKSMGWPGAEPMLVVAGFAMVFWICFNSIKIKKYNTILRSVVFLILILGLKFTPKEKLEKWYIIKTAEHTFNVP
jgi:hypothetical protein